MILFVFEGRKKEPTIFESLRKIYFPQDESVVVCTYNTDFHSLYKELEENEWELFYVLREHLQKQGDNTLSGYMLKDFAEIYLFFDYDFQNTHIDLEEQNRRLSAMLEFFSEETENGRLYVNYPMVEAIACTKELPDNKFDDYTVSRDDSRHFKKYVSEFSFYPDLSFLTMYNKNNVSNAEVRQNWENLKSQHVYKANWLCNKVKFTMPHHKETIDQQRVFQVQRKEYVECLNMVSILSAFPLFVYDYLKKGSQIR